MPPLWKTNSMKHIIEITRTSEIIFGWYIQRRRGTAGVRIFGVSVARNCIPLVDIDFIFNQANGKDEMILFCDSKKRYLSENGIRLCWVCAVRRVHFMRVCNHNLRHSMHFAFSTRMIVMLMNNDKMPFRFDSMVRHRRSLAYAVIEADCNLRWCNRIMGLGAQKCTQHHLWFPHEFCVFVFLFLLNNTAGRHYHKNWLQCLFKPIIGDEPSTFQHTHTHWRFSGIYLLTFSNFIFPDI